MRGGGRLRAGHIAMLGLLLALALALRLAVAWQAWSGGRSLAGDEGSYYELAIALAQQGTFAQRGVPAADRLPIYPLAIAPFYRLIDDRPFTALPLNVLLSVATVAGIYLLGRQIFSAQVGLVAAGIGAIDGALVGFTRVLQTETLYVALVLFACLAIVRAVRQRAVWILPAGILAGLAALTRPHFLPVLPFIAGWILLAARGRPRRSIGLALALIGLVGVFLIPWTVRNWLLLDGFVPITTQSCPPVIGIYNDRAGDLSDLGRFGTWQNIPWPAGVPATEGCQIRRQAAIAWIRAHPDRALLIWLAQPIHLWRYGGETLRLLALPLYYLTLVAALAGLPAAGRRAGAPLFLWIGLAVGLIGFAWLTYGDPRHRLVLHPFLDVLAAFSLVWIWDRLAVWRRGRGRARSALRGGASPPTMAQPAIAGMEEGGTWPTSR